LFPISIRCYSKTCVTKTALTPYTTSQNIYVVSVDSRGKSIADLECYKEHTVDRNYFNEQFRDYPKTVCVKSQVAALCGLDLKIYYHEHNQHTVQYYDDAAVLGDGISRLHQTNGIASLLTFCPDTGLVKHKVMGKAHVVLKEGEIPLSKRQVWGLEEFIREALALYKNHHSTQQAKHSAKRELLAWCYQYQQATWYPHSIYEPRHDVHEIPIRPNYQRQRLSSISDQATCHHGCTHVHHKGHHDCCRGHDKEGDATTTRPVHNHVLSHPDPALECGPPHHDRHIHTDPSGIACGPHQRNDLCHD
jgi:hypothetical protein